MGFDSLAANEPLIYGICQGTVPGINVPVSIQLGVLEGHQSVYTLNGLPSDGTVSGVKNALSFVGHKVTGQGHGRQESLAYSIRDEMMFYKQFLWKED